MILTNHRLHTQPAAFHRLTLLVQRLLDAEVLCDAEGAALLTESEAARHSLEAGDIEAARQHVEQVAHCTKVLVDTQALPLADGSAVLEMARFILTENARF